MSSYNNNLIELKRRTKKLTNEKLLSEQHLKPRSKKLSNQEFLQVLPFYDDVGILKTQRALRNYFETYGVETIDKKV